MEKICMRCGMSRDEVKRTQKECNVYDKHYGNHSYIAAPKTL